MKTREIVERLRTIKTDSDQAYDRASDEGRDADYAALVIYDMETDKLIQELESEHIEPDTKDGEWKFIPVPRFD